MLKREEHSYSKWFVHVLWGNSNCVSLHLTVASWFYIPGCEWFTNINPQCLYNTSKRCVNLKEVIYGTVIDFNTSAYWTGTHTIWCGGEDPFFSGSFILYSVSQLSHSPVPCLSAPSLNHSCFPTLYPCPLCLGMNTILPSRICIKVSFNLAAMQSLYLCSFYPYEWHLQGLRRNRISYATEMKHLAKLRAQGFQKGRERTLRVFIVGHLQASRMFGPLVNRAELPAAWPHVSPSTE